MAITRLPTAPQTNGHPPPRRCRVRIDGIPDLPLPEAEIVTGAQAAAGHLYDVLVVPSSRLRAAPLSLPGCQILAVADGDSPAETADTLRAGADGWAWGPDPLIVQAALHHMTTGRRIRMTEAHMAAVLRDRATDRPPVPAHEVAAVAALTTRAMQLLRHCLAGHSRAETAAAMRVAEATVAHHARALLCTLGVSTSMEAAAMGRRVGVRPIGWAPDAVDHLLSAHRSSLSVTRYLDVPARVLQRSLQAPHHPCQRTPSRVANLTDAERTVMRHLIAGHGIATTATHMGLSHRHVAATRTGAYAALAARHSMHATYLAYSGGLTAA